MCVCINEFNAHKNPRQSLHASLQPSRTLKPLAADVIALKNKQWLRFIANQCIVYGSLLVIITLLYLSGIFELSMLLADIPLAELLLIRLEVITGALHN